MSIVRGERLGCECEPAGRYTFSPNVYQQACKASCLSNAPKNNHDLEYVFDQVPAAFSVVDSPAERIEGPKDRPTNQHHNMNRLSASYFPYYAFQKLAHKASSRRARQRSMPKTPQDTPASFYHLRGEIGLQSTMSALGEWNSFLLFTEQMF
jgi:hypothetical protein